MAVHRTGFTLPLDELRNELDRFWTTLVTPPPQAGQAPRPEPGCWSGHAPFPAVNFHETDEAFSVEAEIPGVDASHVDVSVSGDELVIKGSRPAHDSQPKASDAPCSTGEGCCQAPASHADASAAESVRHEGKVVWHLRERGTGSFERRLTLPVAVDAERVEARLVDGVLTVTCPKLAACQPRKVPVRGG